MAQDPVRYGLQIRENPSMRNEVPGQAQVEQELLPVQDHLNLKTGFRHRIQISPRSSSPVSKTIFPNTLFAPSSHLSAKFGPSSAPTERIAHSSTMPPEKEPRRLQHIARARRPFKVVHCGSNGENRNPSTIPIETNGWPGRGRAESRPLPSSNTNKVARRGSLLAMGKLRSKAPMKGPASPLLLLPDKAKLIMLAWLVTDPVS